MHETFNQDIFLLRLLALFLLIHSLVCHFLILLEQ